MDYLIYSVEDDQDISKIINKTLSKQGYEVVSFFDGNSLMSALKDRVPQMILLDMMLPDLSGSEILKILRSNPLYNDVEIIIVSANNLAMDKVEGLDLGADDYIEKPFDILELMSRINAKYRRHKRNEIYYSKDLSLDIGKHICLCGDKEISLTVKEFEILTILMQNKGNVVSREDILNRIWGENEVLESRTVDMHIKSIRQKLKDESYIQTVYGVGYRILS